MSWRIIMIEQGEYLRLKLDNLFVKKQDKEYTIPLTDISTIVVSNLDTLITCRLLDALTRYNISLVVCDHKHQPSGVFTGLNTHSRASKVIRQQLDWSEHFKNYTWSLIISSKILNQHDVLIKHHKDSESTETLSKYISNISLGDSSNREGHAAKVYFNSMFGKSFSRNDDSVLNACLNYGYAVIRAFFARLIVAYGFNGAIGLFHKSEYNNFNLVDDLLEPFRPIYDDYIVSLINDDTIFDFETRYMIIDFLNTKIKYEGMNLLMMNAIEKYITNFIKYSKTLDENSLTFPTVPTNERLQ